MFTRAGVSLKISAATNIGKPAKTFALKLRLPLCTNLFFADDHRAAKVDQREFVESPRDSLLTKI